MIGGRIMEKIMNVVKEKISMGYSPVQLAVEFGIFRDEKGDFVDEGYFISKVNGWGYTPITEILVHDDEVDDDELIAELDKLGVAYCL